MKIRPIGERVLAKREEVEEKSTGGIILTETFQEKPNQGEVRAVGDTEEVQVGDTIIFGKYAGNDVIEVDGEDLIILEVSDIKAVIYP